METETHTTDTQASENNNKPVWTIENVRTHKIFKIENPKDIHSIKIHYTNAKNFKSKAIALNLSGKYCIEITKTDTAIDGDDLMYVIDGIPTRTQCNRDYEALAYALRDKSDQNQVIQLNGVYHTKHFKSTH